MVVIVMSTLHATCCLDGEHLEQLKTERMRHLDG